MIRTAPIIDTPRLRLRPHRREDFGAVAALWGDPAVVRHISGTPASAEASWARLLRYSGHWALMGFGYWVVETRDGTFTGEVGLADYRRDIVPELDVPEAGWVIAPAAQGKGVATEAMQAVLGWADMQLPGSCTCCIIAPGHDASLRVAKKLGYGRARDAIYHGAASVILSRVRGGG